MGWNRPQRILLGVLITVWGGSACTTSFPAGVPAAPPATASLQGQVFDDRNGNGLADPEERGLAGISVFVDSNENGRWDDNEPRQITTADGTYRWAGLAAGPYTLRAVFPKGRIQTAPSRGDRNPLPAIIGGQPVPEGMFPWMVALLAGSGATGDPVRRFFCGGTLVAPEWVLTAAHCFFDPNSGLPTHRTLTVLVGTTDLSGMQGQQISMRQVFIHPNYVGSRIDLGSDVALVELERPYRVPSVSVVGPGTLAWAAAGKQASIVGWGTTQEGGAVSSLLRQAVLPIVTNGICQTGYGGRYAIVESQICAGFSQGGVDTCQGDSGGPLLVHSPEGGWVQAGITSFGDGCARPQRYGIYTRLSSFAATYLESTITAQPQGAFTGSLTPGETQTGVDFGSKLLFVP